MASPARVFDHASVAPFQRKPPVSVQSNSTTERYESPPEQLELPLPPMEDIILPKDGKFILLAWENGAITGIRMRIGGGEERRASRREAEEEGLRPGPVRKLQEILIASRGASVSRDLIEELDGCGIRIACLSSSGKPVALNHVSAADGHIGNTSHATGGQCRQLRRELLPVDCGKETARSGEAAAVFREEPRRRPPNEFGERNWDATPAAKAGAHGGRSVGRCGAVHADGPGGCGRPDLLAEDRGHVAGWFGV